MTTEATRAPGASSARILVPLLVGAAVSVLLGVYGHYHKATGFALHVAGFSNLVTAKVWLATIATFFALIQLGSALVMYGRIKAITPPSWIGRLHRWSGRIAFFVTVPVAVACLYALGFEDYTTRVLIHSLLGCVFFGVFTMKMLVLTKRGIAGWVLPLLGGLVFAVLVGVWLTSALWYFTTTGAA
jgi:Family of unknown function (DUF6529)